MELRKRQGERVTRHGQENCSEKRGEAKNDEGSDGNKTTDDRSITGGAYDSVYNASNSKGAVDAVVGAAVRGGSLLMLLALIQRASTFILNVLLQRAMLSSSDSGYSPTDESNARPTSALEEYGAAAITLELISSTALFIAREPFRVALARSRVSSDALQDIGDREKEQREAYRQRFVNTAWLSAPVGLAFAAFVWLAYPWVLRNDAFNGVKENRQAATLVCVAAAAELMCEPLALIFQYRLLIDVRVRAEAGAVLVLGVSRYLLVTRARMGVLSFGYAQLLHSLTLVFAYLIFAAKDVVRATTTQVESTARTEPSVKCLPQKNVPGNYQGFAQLRGWLPGRPKFSKREGHDGVVSEWMDHGQLRLAGALAGQSLLKHVLTEGDKIVLARATTLGQGCSGGSQGSCSQGGSLYEQGVYAIASGYGSLAARLLFQPLEEAARLMFSKLGVEEGSASALDVMAMPKSNGEVEDSSSGRVAEPRKKYCWDGAGGCRLRERMAILLATLLKLVLTAGLVFVCFGFHYTETLLRLLLAGRGGDRAGFATVSKVAQVLSWYCVYVLFLAANGMCEAFACAVARGSQLTGMGAGLVVSFAAFWALVGPLTSRFGTRGLVMANAAGMACRVLCSAAFIRRFFLQQAPIVDGNHSSRRSVSVAATAFSRGGKRVQENNLWLEVLIRALPHPFVFVAMTISSVVAHATSPTVAVEGGDDKGIAPWNVVAAAKHVVIGAACFGLTAAVFARYERRFFRELRSLWAARR